MSQCQCIPFVGRRKSKETGNLYLCLGYDLGWKETIILYDVQAIAELMDMSTHEFVEYFKDLKLGENAEILLERRPEGVAK